MMKLNHEESPNIVSVDVRNLIQSADTPEENTGDITGSETLEFPISEEQVIFDESENLQETLQSQESRSELGELKWNTDHVFHGPQNPVLNMKQEYLLEDHQQSKDFGVNRINENVHGQIVGVNNQHGERIQFREQRISEVSDEKPITTNGIEKIKRPKFSCKDCSFIGINKYDIIRHRRTGYRVIFEPSLLLG